MRRQHRLAHLLVPLCLSISSAGFADRVQSDHERAEAPRKAASIPHGAGGADLRKAVLSIFANPAFGLDKVRVAQLIMTKLEGVGFHAASDGGGVKVFRIGTQNGHAFVEFEFKGSSDGNDSGIRMYRIWDDGRGLGEAMAFAPILKGLFGPSRAGATP